MNKRYIEISVFICSVLLMIYSVFFIGKLKPVSYFSQSFLDGEILQVINEKIDEDPYIAGRYLGYQKLKIKILEGKLKNKIFIINNTITTQHNVVGKKGLKAVFTVRENNGEKSIWLYNYKREKYIYFLGGIFALIICVLGKINGFKSLVALFFTGSVIIGILIPLIFNGFDPISSAIFSSALIIFISFILISGLNKKSIAAILGTIFGIVTAGVLSYIVGKMARLSGVNMEKGEQILYLAKDYNIRVKGLMFVSILISSLGAVMDVAMSISSASSEIFDKNNTLNIQEHFLSVMNIGRDIMGTMTNTLILAFTGSSFTLIMMIWGYNMSYKQFINIPLIGIEAIQGLAGSIGIILTVPFTAFVSTIFLKYYKLKYKEKTREDGNEKN